MHCTHRRGFCSQKPLKLEAFEQLLTIEIQNLCINNEEWNLGIELLKERYKQESGNNKRHLSNLHIQYQRIRDRIDELFNMRADKEIGAEEYKERHSSLTSEQSRLKSLLEDNEDSSNNWLEKSESFLNRLFEAEKVLNSKNPNQIKELLFSVGENFILKDGNIVITYKKPFDVMLEPAYRTSWLTVWDHFRTIQVC